MAQAGILTNTHIKELKGAYMDSEQLKQVNVVARSSSDKRGETLSFESNGVMIIVPYEPIASLIAECRRDKNRKRN